MGVARREVTTVLVPFLNHATAAWPLRPANSLSPLPSLTALTFSVVPNAEAPGATRAALI